MSSLQNWPSTVAPMDRLATQLASGTLPHAVLLLGEPELTDTLGLYMAKVLLCQDSRSRPCETCEACTQINRLTNPDFYSVGVDGTSLKTADIEVLQDWLLTRPHHAQAKVYILHGMNQITPVAANRLLKTLEEPNAHVFAILTSTTRSGMLPTILSRSFAFHVRGHLDDWLDASSSRALRNSENEENPSFAPFLDAMVQWTESWLLTDAPSLALADSWMGAVGSLELSTSLTLLAAWFQYLMHRSLGASSLTTRFAPFSESGARLSQRLTTDAWLRSIEIVMQTKRRTAAHVVSLLNTEQMCIRLREVSHRR